MPKTLAPPNPKLNWRLAVRVLAWVGVAAGLAFGAKETNAFLLRDPRFGMECAAGQTTCADLEIRGAVYTSKQRIQAVFAGDFGQSVFHMPLAERRRHLLAVDWIDTAAVSRVWPNRIVVAITERRPGGVRETADRRRPALPPGADRRRGRAAGAAAARSVPVCRC